MLAKTRAPALRATALAAAAVVAMILPGRAYGAPPAAALAAPASTAATTSTHAAPGTGPIGSVPTEKACARPEKTGYAACQALVRTDAVAHQGRLAALSVPQGYGPADLQSAYSLTTASAVAGSHATVAIIDAFNDPNAEADLAVYRKQYGLPPCTTANGCFRKISQRGGTDYPTFDYGWATEISLDLDMVSAVCPHCRILLVEADDNSFVNLGTAVNEAVALGARYVSNSYSAYGGAGYGSNGGIGNQLEAQYYNHPGVVMTAAAGDYGWGMGFPADSPHVTSVGGTSLSRDPTAARGWKESVWAFTGGGCGSNEGFPKPIWQQVPNLSPDCTSRTDNDVAAVADPATGVAVYDTFADPHIRFTPGWNVFGGTSVATPVIASVYALAGQPVGGTYPVTYPYADPSGLNDITSGTMDMSAVSGTCDGTYICAGVPGYDVPTGLGTPNGTGAFTAGPHGWVSGVVRDPATGHPVSGATITIGTASAYTDAAGRYRTSAPAGTYTVTAAKFGYAGQPVTGVTVTSGGQATANIALRALPMATVSGRVTDASGHGWPLYAQIQVNRTQVNAYTDPATGRYRLKLPVTGTPYTLHASAVYPGYTASDIRFDLPAGGLRHNVGLPVDRVACDAPGYRPVDTGITQTFDNGTAPAGWTVTTPYGGGWIFNNPNHRPNLTGGSRGFALADNVLDTTLQSPMFDLSKDATPVLAFRQDLEASPSGIYPAIVNMIVNGAWYPYVFSQSGSVPGPATEVVPLPQAADHSQVQVQFHAQNSTWEIDDVFIGERTCKPVPGGLAVGQVLDRTTGQPVNGASVTISGQPVTTVPEPGDPKIGGGLYWLFDSTAGSQALTATAGGYTPARAQVNITSNAVTHADLSLTAGRLQARPGSISVHVQMGHAATVRLRVTNTGTAPATLNLNAQQGPITPGGTRAATAGAPLRLIPGHYTPGVLATPPGHGAAHPAGTRSAAPPAPSPWTTRTIFPWYTADNAAATDPVTGRVYSTGGLERGYYLPQAFMYDPATKAWTQLPEMKKYREAPVAAFIHGKFYVTGGFSGITDMVPDLEIYDPASNAWSTGAPIPNPAYGSSAAVLDGKMYVVGGCAAPGSCTDTNVQVYDPATNTWTKAAVYPRKIAFAQCGAIGGKLYCAGGFDHDLGYGTSAAYAYDPKANTWTRVADMPVDLWGGAYTAANGQLLVSGGITRFDSELTNQGVAYDPATNTWNPLPNAPDTVYRGGSACGLYRIGGLATGSVLGPESAAVDQLPGYTECDGGAGVPWLTAKPGQITLAPGQSATITLTLNAGAPSITQPGSYTARLRLDGNTPYLPQEVNVAMTATRS